jgi:uncharacterized protein YdhG (YjbR/CyaY superfamily)
VSNCKSVSRTTLSGANPVSNYISAAPKVARGKLREMRALVAAAAPGAVQELKWGMPAFSYRRIVVMFAAFKKHLGFFITPEIKRAFADELTGYKSASSSVQLPLDRPLPRTLIRRIVRARIAALKKRDANWRQR